MKKHAVLTVVGRDRLGIVDDVTEAILGERCNVEESRMAVLGGEFAGILLVSGEGDGIDRLVAGLPRIGESLGLHVELKRTDPPRSDERSRPYLIESVSLDSPGIVHAVTAVLRRHGVNIEDLETETTAAPWTGAPMFRLRARISVPQGEPSAVLREEIEELGASRDIDIVMKALTAPGF